MPLGAFCANYGWGEGVFLPKGSSFIFLFQNKNYNFYSTNPKTLSTNPHYQIDKNTDHYFQRHKIRSTHFKTVSADNISQMLIFI